MNQSTPTDWVSVVTDAFLQLMTLLLTFAADFFRQGLAAFLF